MGPPLAALAFFALAPVGLGAPSSLSPSERTSSSSLPESAAASALPGFAALASALGLAADLGAKNAAVALLTLASAAPVRGQGMAGTRWPGCVRGGTGSNERGGGKGVGGLT